MDQPQGAELTDAERAYRVSLIAAAFYGQCQRCLDGRTGGRKVGVRRAGETGWRRATLCASCHEAAAADPRLEILPVIDGTRAD